MKSFNYSNHSTGESNVSSSAKKAFFRPFVGSKYYATGFYGKRILVVGASFYCDKKQCPYFSKCTDERIKDSSAYDKICPEYNKQEHLLLSDCPTYELEGGNAYVRFGNSISKLFFDSKLSWNEVWEMFSFTNYIQFILPHWQTYGYDISDRDKEALIEVVDEINPDVIVVWGVVVNDPIKSLAHDEDVKMKSGGYLCHWAHNGKEIAIVNPYHPTSSAYYSETDIEKFTLALKEAING